MADNIGQVFNVVDDSGNVSLNIAACLTVISLFNWFLLFFGLIYIFRTISAVKSGGNVVSEK